jgi:hypothetical protein
LLAWILGVLPALIAIYFFLTNDWTSRLGKIPGLDPVMRWLASWQPGLAAYRFDANSVGGILAILMPLQIVAWRRVDAPYRSRLGIPFVGMALVGLVMSASRGGWVALTVAMVSWALWQSVRRLAEERGRTSRTANLIGSAAVVLVVIVVALCLFVTPWGDRLLALRTDRLQVWRNSLDLISDYPFTGIGLGNFTMAYSSYALLVHVPHTIHAHNLLLDIWFDQGLLGLLAFGGLLTQAMWSGSGTAWRPVAVASIGVLVLHGLLDDAFYGYGGHAIPFLFIPFAVLGQSEARTSSLPALTFWGIVTVILAISMILPGTRAIVQANLGALAQTQAELSIYSNEKWGLQDALRRSPQLDLTSAINFYQAALALDPNNATANRRMGQVGLSRGEYGAACQHIQAAFAVAPYQRATRQMQGECYALADDPAQATAIWQTISLSEGQLDIRYGWYMFLGKQDTAANISQAARGLHQ